MILVDTYCTKALGSTQLLKHKLLLDKKFHFICRCHGNFDFEGGGGGAAKMK